MLLRWSPYSILLLLLYIRTGESIKCSTCTTKRMGEECYTNPPPATQCGREFTKCVTFINYNRQRMPIFVFRGCSEGGPPYQCNPMNFQSTEFVNCAETCSTDACNRNNYAFALLDLYKK